MSKKSAAGAGSIRQRPDGRWEARLSYVDELGARRRKSFYADTQREARQKLTAALKAVDDGTFRETQRYTVQAWMLEWMEVYGGAWKPRTQDDYKRKSEKHIFPELGSVQLTALTTTKIQRFINGLSTKHGLSPKSVKNIHGVLHSSLKQAVASGVISHNPADNINLPKAQKPNLAPVMDEDLPRFLAACEKEPAPYGLLFSIATFTGLRQSELLGLQWSDIDFDSGVIHVQRQLQKRRESSEYFLLPTKNGKDRFVPFPPSVAALFRQMHRQQAIWKMQAGLAWKNTQDFVFTVENGEHCKHSTVQNNFRRLRNSLGLQARFHDLRHSCAILALQSGCSIKAVSDMLGHYSSSFTMDTYASTSKAMQQDTQNRMEAVFRAASGG